MSKLLGRRFVTALSLFIGALSLVHAGPVDFGEQKVPKTAPMGGPVDFGEM